MNLRYSQPEPDYDHENFMFMNDANLVFKRIGHFLLACTVHPYRPSYVQNLKTNEVFFTEDHDTKTIRQLYEIAKEN